MDDLSPYQPSPERPWDRAAAAHLLRRAGFAPSETEVRAALADGPAATIDRLINQREDGSRHDELDELGPRLAQRDDIASLRAWWLLRMAHTQRPLHARMAVFWHNHFATSNAKVRSGVLMLRQLRTFERHGLGRFGDLLLAVSRDPAMIVWLDGDQNVKGRPNENYARELLELFSLGVGNYSEADIRDTARAFTGWRQQDGVFRFARHEHDDGPKAVLGTTGPLDGADVVAIAVHQPACARFLAAKLLHEFLCPDPAGALVDALAVRLRETDFDLGAAVRTLLSSRAMFDPRYRAARIKSPVEYAVGIIRSLEMRVAGAAIGDAVSQMGQRLFEPPSVKGWDGHRAWLNSATMLVRLNGAVGATTPGEAGFQPGELRNRYNLADREGVARFCEDLILDSRVPTAVHNEIVGVDGQTDDGMRQIVRLLLTNPEYQMA